MTSPKIVTLGELLIRLKTADQERFFQSSNLEATFGGAEVNVAVSLAHFGLDASLVTALPAHALGDAALRYVHQFGVETTQVIRQGERLGIYYLEAGPANGRLGSSMIGLTRLSQQQARPALIGIRSLPMPLGFT